MNMLNYPFTLIITFAGGLEQSFNFTNYDDAEEAGQALSVAENVVDWLIA